MTRTAEFAKDEGYEALLERLNTSLAGLELPGTAPQLPVLLIQGVPRSGTTLLYQLLAHTGLFTYPSNLVARFYRAPAMGLLIQRLAQPLLDPPRLDLTSRAGLTEGWWGPHEFGYFWRHHLGLKAHHEPEQPDLTELILQLGRMEATGDAPLLFKNGLLSYATPLLRDALPTLKIVRIHRDAHDVQASILQMRERYHGDRGTWWSLRPEDLSLVAGAPPEDQVAFQVAHATEALDAAGSDLEITYTELCADPRGVLRLVAALIEREPDLHGFPAEIPKRKRRITG